MEVFWGAVLQGKLKRYGISQKELAKKLGKSYQWVSYVLNGKRRTANKYEYYDAVNELIKERGN